MAASIMQKPKEKIAWGLFHPCWSILHFEICRLTSSQAENIGRGSLEPYYHLTMKERKKERKRKGQLGTIKLLSWKGQTHCESIYRQSYLAFTRGWFHYLNVWPPYHTIATPTLVPREKEKEREEEENKFYLEVFGSRALFRCRLCPCDVVLHTSQQW